MAIYPVKATKKKRVSQWKIHCHRESIYSHSGGSFNEMDLVLSCSGIRCWGRSEGGICWLGFKTSVYSTWRSGRSVSACYSSPPGPSWRCRSGAGWSLSPGRTISRNTLHHRCCLQRTAGQDGTQRERFQLHTESSSHSSSMRSDESLASMMG